MKKAGAGGLAIRHPNDNDDLYRSRKQYRKRELKQHAKRLQILELSELRKPDSYQPALKPK